MIEFLCTMTGLVAGVIVASSLLAARQEEFQEGIDSALEQINLQKIQSVVNQIQSLSSRVSSDVSSHSSKVEDFSAILTAAAGEDPSNLLSAIDEIILANQTMQGQLQEAQKRLAEQSEIIEETMQQAHTDALTGLANRRALDEYLKNTIKDKADTTVVGLLLLDIDRFKSFNDTYGHLAGDAVLTCFAHSMAEICDKVAYPARYGGEEFAVIFTADNVPRLVELAAKVRKFVSEQKIHHEDLELTVTASGGLSIIQPGDTLSVAYERSDEGLYQAKENGRNRGFWLTPEGWQAFPEVYNTRMSEGQIFNGADFAGSQQATNEQMSGQSESEVSSEPINSAEASDGVSKASIKVSPDAPTCLDLSTYVNRVGEQLGKLQRSGLPAGCIMIEALEHSENSLDQDSWHQTLSIIQSCLRGIDLLCQFRPRTASVFLPGCSPEAVVDRAAEMLTRLNEALQDWGLATQPKQFAVAVGHSGDHEEAGRLLDRLEQTLDEAHDASASEMVIHNGESTYFQQL
jgi:diguanylate cyclase (GGDEF)-like protein